MKSKAFPREKCCLQFLPLMVFLLLIIFVTQSEAYCPRNNPHDTCYLLQESLKTALLNSSQNLYNLREEFFPSSHSSPVFGYVNYTISLDKPFSGDEPQCQPYDSDPPYTLVFFNDSKFHFIWTDSALLSKIDPFILSYYQLEILSVIYSQVGILDYRFYSYPPKPEYLTLDLALFVESLPCIPTEGQLLDILTDLTSWLKVYAKAQGDLITTHGQWDVGNKGYGVSAHSSSEGSAYGILYANFWVLSALITAVLWGISPEMYREVGRKCSRYKAWSSFFWGAAVVAFLWNLTVIIGEPILLLNYWVYHRHRNHIHKWGVIYGLTRTVEIPIFIIADLVAASYIVYRIGRDVTFPIPALFTDTLNIFSHFRRQYQKYGQHKSKFLRMVALWSLLISLHLATIGVLPTVLWVFVFPIRMMWILFLMVSSTFMLVMFMGTLFSIFPITSTNKIFSSALIEEENTGQTRLIRNRRFQKVFLQLFIAPLLIATVALLVVLYLNLLTTEINTSSAAGVLASFLPSAMLTVLGWYVTVKTRALLLASVIHTRKESRDNINGHEQSDDEKPLDP